jgi:hypothetical protein
MVLTFLRFCSIVLMNLLHRLFFEILFSINEDN